MLSWPLLLFLSCEDVRLNSVDSSGGLGYNQVSTDFIKAVLKQDGTVWTWGPNYTGALGNGTSESSDIPEKVPNLENVISIDQSFGAVVALDKASDIWFWGNLWIYSGPPDVDINVVSPIKIAHLSGAKTLTLYKTLIFILGDDSTVWQMVLDANSPKIVDGPTNLVAIGQVHSICKNLAATRDGRTYDLGAKSFLQDGLKEVAAAARGNLHYLALTKDGNIWAWGKNDLGQLGNGTFEDSDLPVEVANLTRVSSISTNYNFNLAVREDGTVWFWGFEGQHGDTLFGRNIPAKVEGLPRVVLASAGAESLLMGADGTYWTFRYDDRVPRLIQFP
jgi:alpha-tubulin suppressor-like RCC1 family protein